MKNIINFLFFISVIFISISPVITSAEDKNDWTQFRLNSENNPVIDSDSLSKIKSVISTEDEIRSTPVIVDDKMFVGNHDSGYIYAFDLETGEELWRNQANNWIHSEITYINDQLFVGYGNRFFQDDGDRGTGKSGLLSLDPHNGEILWDFKTKGEVMPTPAFYKDTVYITTGDRYLYGIDPDEGIEKWSLELGSTVSMSSPNIKDGTLYVGGSAPYKSFAIDLEKKEIKWEREFEKINSGMDDVPPVVSDSGIVYTTGVKKTEEPLSLKQTFEKDGTVSTYKQIVKLIFGPVIGKKPENNYEHMFYAMDIQNGELIWKKSLGTGSTVSNNKSGAPMLYDDKIFVGSPITQSFYAYNADNGDKLWDYESNVNKAPPVADKDIVYFTDTKGLVYGFDTNSGELKGKKKLSGKLAPSGPVLVNDHLIVGSQDTNVYSVPTKDILQSDDSVEKESNSLSFILFVYVIPILLLLISITIVFFVMRYGINRLRINKTR